MELVLSGF